LKPINNNKETNLIVGYENEEIATLLKLLGYTNTKKLNTQQINARLFEDNKIDMYALFVSLESKELKKINEDFKMEIIDYGENIDLQQLKVSVPFIKKENIDFGLYFKQYRGKRDNIKTVIAFDVLLYGYDEINYSTDAINILQSLKNIEALNYYQQYFTIYNISDLLLRRFNKNVLEKNNRDILEQFTTTSNTTDFTFTMNKNVDGFYNSVVRKLIINTDVINTLPLKKDAIFILQNQYRNEENGTYKVTSVSKHQSVLKRIDRQRVFVNREDSPFDPRYRCINDPDIKSKGLCESARDVEGRLKRKPTYWDRPCETNEECPFYQVNKNYKNYRNYFNFFHVSFLRFITTNSSITACSISKRL
jgi:hypothetical protein